MDTFKSKIQEDYARRMHRVFQFIDENLDRPITLQTVSEIAFFSPFHFHRIFKYCTGETLNRYVHRQKIEKSALDLLHSDYSNTALSHRYGFSDVSSFSKAFKKYYGVSPTVFQKQNSNRFSKIRQLKSKNGQEYPNHEKYICILDNLKKWITMNAKIEVKEMPKMDLAYVSSIGSENLGSAYQKLIRWATPRGLMHEQTKMVTVYYDSFKVTQADKVRMSASILLNEPIPTEKEIGLNTIPAGKYIVGRYMIEPHEFEKSWTGLFLWMNENGYKKANKEPFEIYYNDFNTHPEKKVITDFCIPIE